jgi:hypothetical protein
MVLSQALAGSLPRLYDASMVPLRLAEEKVEQDETSMRLQDVAKSFGKECSVAFVVRRPG